MRINIYIPIRVYKLYDSKEETKVIGSSIKDYTRGAA